VAGADNHDHAFAALTPNLVHAPNMVTTGGPNTTMNINAAGFITVMDAVHWYTSNPLGNHVIAGMNIGQSNDLSPALALGFYIRGF